MIFAARATGHTTTWIEWNMSMTKVRQAATIWMEMQGTEMQSVEAIGGSIDPAEYDLVMGGKI